MLVTGTVIKQFQQDGTFRITNEDNADAILKGEIVAVGRSPARSVRGNVLATTEFNLALRVRYTLVGRDGKPIAGPSEAAGATSFFVGDGCGYGRKAGDAAGRRRTGASTLSAS